MRNGLHKNRHIEDSVMETKTQKRYGNQTVGENEGKLKRIGAWKYSQGSVRDLTGSIFIRAVSQEVLVY